MRQIVFPRRTARKFDMTPGEKLQALPPRTRIVRVMPNVACEVRESATVYYSRDKSTELDQITQAVFGPISPICHRIADEKLMDAATALSGSGPAYILYIIEALADAGVRQGFPRDVALRLATQTVQVSDLKSAVGTCYDTERF